MLIRRHGMPIVRWSAALAVMATVVIAMSWRADVRAQLPLQAVGSPFEITGFIQAATVDSPNDPFSGGTITVNNHFVVVPRNTIFQMPATSMTWQELFKNAPAAYSAFGQTGMALTDTPKPLTTFEVIIQGNRVCSTADCSAGTYVAGLLFLAQNSLQSHQGFINFIDYATGELYIGGQLGARLGARVRINDPLGRFGRVTTHDPRFTIDEENPTIKSETAYPMCIPRTDPASADDPLCPQGNRPRDTVTLAPQMIFTMPPAAAPLAGELANPASRPVPPGGDPWRMAPFEVGDYLTVSGPLAADAAGHFISAWGITANVGIFTTPGTLPAYVSIDVLLMNTGVNTDTTLLQEAAKRVRFEGFTTDISTAISVNAIDVDRCTGNATDRNFALQAVDPGAPNGAVAGRWRFRPGAPLFNLKGFPFLPSTREMHAVSINGTVPAAFGLTGLKMGEYTAPNFSFDGPENLGIGNPKPPMNFQDMPFLAQGEGPRDAFDPFGTGAPSLGVPGQMSPWPGATAPALIACPPAPPPGTDTTSPVVSNVASNPASPITALGTPTITFTATATDNVGVTSVVFLFAGNTTVATAPTTPGGSTFSVTVATPPVNRRSPYFLTVTAKDAAGNVSAPGLMLVTVQ